MSKKFKVLLLWLFLAVVPLFVHATEDPFKILRVSATDSAETIKKRYRRLVFEIHPDRHPGKEKEYTQRLAVVNDAYDRIKKGAQPEAPSQGPQPKKDPGFAEAFRHAGFDHADIDNRWDSWGDNVNWDRLSRDIRNRLDGMDKADAMATEQIIRVYPHTTEWAKENHVYHYVFRMIRQTLSRLIEDYEFYLFLGGQDPDPVSHFVQEQYRNKERLVTFLSFTFGHGNKVKFEEGLSFMGPDPNMRTSHIEKVKDQYRVENTLESSKHEIMAMTVFIYQNFYRIRYIPKVAAGLLATGRTVSEGWGRYSALQLLSTILPYLRFANMRHDLLLRVLGNAGDKFEFVQIATLYLYEIMMQQKYKPEFRATTTLEQGRANVLRAIESRGEDVGISNYVDLLREVRELRKTRNPLFDFFQRRDGTLHPYEWLLQEVNDDPQPWIGKAVFPEKMQPPSQLLTNVLLMQIQQELAQNRQRLLHYRAFAEHQPEPTRSQILDIIRKRRAQIHFCNRLLNPPHYSD